MISPGLHHHKTIRFTIIALIGSIIEYGIFCRILLNFEIVGMKEIFYATVASRFLSAGMTFYFIKKYCFNSNDGSGREVFRYYTLITVQMCFSAILTALLSDYGIREQTGKILADILLFFVGYQLQKEWVFQKKDRKRNKMK